ncbi:cupin, partial [Burkholderia multivorans]|nr:cupin [Burkholderia multivorans]
MLRIGNLFDIERTPGDGERFDTLVTGSNVTIERIVSAGHASPPGFWYDDPRAEWVVLLSGAAERALGPAPPPPPRPPRAP